jgi:O-antigen/teichoic acid export membrane protein
VSRKFDSKEISVLTSRLVSLLVGPVTILAVGVFLDPTTQGFYYTFGSVLSAAVFFEAGVSTAVVQLAGHESGKLHKPSNDGIGDIATRDRLSGVFRFAITWFWSVAAAMGLTVFFLGRLIFGANSSTVDWEAPWVGVVVLTTLSFAIQPVFAFLEGLGEVRYVYGYRTARSLIQSLVLIAAISSGLGLYSLVISSFAALVISLLFALLKSQALRAVGWRRGRAALAWRREVLPFQWRIAVSWAAGYFTVSLFTPVLMVVQGPIVAGQMGMTVTLLVACTTISASFIQAHVPALAGLVGADKRVEMWLLFRRKASWAFFVCVSMFAVALAVVGIATGMGIPLVNRIVGLPTLLLLSIGFLAYHLEGVLAFFMRAQKREPYYLLEIIGAVLILPSTLFLGRWLGPVGVAIGFSAVHLLVLLPIALSIFRRSVRRFLQGTDDDKPQPKELQ